MKKHFDKLGLQAEDKVTGFKGVVTTLSFDLYGCIQVVLTPRVAEDGKQPDGRWFDIARLEYLSSTPVMPVPNYEYGHVAEGLQGCSDKSLPY